MVKGSQNLDGSHVWVMIIEPLMNLCAHAIMSVIEGFLREFICDLLL